MSLSFNFIFIIIFYLIGSIPFALILPKLFGFGDIRDIGSGNVGATNVLRTGNKYLAVAVLCLDILKGLVPFLFLNSFFHNIELLHVIILCHFAILGHIFPIWLKFNGGKGVAAYLGILFSINYFFGIVFIVSWLIIFFISKYSSLGSILSSLIIPIFIYFNPNYESEYFFIIMFVLILYTHRENVKRLINKEESKTKIY